MDLMEQVRAKAAANPQKVAFFEADDPKMMEVVGELVKADLCECYIVGDGAALAGWNLAIPKTSKNPDEAWAFICFMASREKAVDYVKAGGTATRASVFENEELAALNPSFEAQKEALVAANGLVEKGLSWIPQHDQINQILEIAGNYGSSALAGDITVEDACEQMQADIEDLLGY